MERKYPYQEETARYIELNRMYVVFTSLWFATLFLYHCFVAEKQFVMILDIIALVVLSIMNSLLYFRFPFGKQWKNLYSVELMVVGVAISWLTSTDFVRYILLFVLLVLIPYYDHKSFQRFFIVAVLIAIGDWGLNFFQNPFLWRKTEELFQVVMEILLLTGVFYVERISKAFAEDVSGYSGEVSTMQSQVVEEMKKMSDAVTDSSHQGNALAENMVHSIKQMHIYLEETGGAAEKVAITMENQVALTGNIHIVLKQMHQCMKELTAIVQESHRQILEQVRMIERILEQSEEIVNKNGEIEGTLKELQNEMDNVVNLTDTIMNVSEQTSLLAIDVSIESARAGYGGRGFVAVADQIRRLSEQARSATEEITQITMSLCQNTVEVESDLNTSFEEAKSQREKFLTADKIFRGLGENMKKLIEKLEILEGQMGRLVQENDRITENMGSISRAAWEVKTVTQEVNSLSKNNLEYAQKVQQTMGQITDKLLSDDFLKDHPPCGNDE